MPCSGAKGGGHAPNEHTHLIASAKHQHANHTTTTRSCTNLASKVGNDLTQSSTKKKLAIATTIALLFFATELIAGYLANSLALMSDAFHLLSDVASFIVALAAIYLAEKPPTKKHTYGFHRAEVIAALVSVLTIWVLTGFLVMEAIERIRKPQVIDARLMCITASIGVLVNVILACVLGGHHHHHHHEHGHGDNESHHHHHHSDHKEVNINLRAAALHVLGDLLASIGVLISSVILLFKPNYSIVDPLCTFVFSVIVLYTTYHLVQDSIGVLMEGAPGHIQTDAIEKSLQQIPGVIAVHDLHIWTLSPGKSSLTAHILADLAACDYDSILSQGQSIVCGSYGIHHSTLQIESDTAGFTSHCRPHICSSSSSSGR